MPVVTAMTYPDDDREIPAREVTGELTVREVSAERTQCLVDGVLVDPETVRPEGEPAPVQKAATFDESKVKRDHGKFAEKPGQGGGDASETTAPARPAPAPAKGPPTEKGHAGVPPPDEHELEGLSHLVPKADRGSWEKIRDTFEAVRAALFVKLSELSVTAGDLAPDVLDTAEDYSTMKASVYGNMDSWHEATGVSWTFTQVLVKHAIGAGFKAAKYARGDEARKADEAAGDRAEQIVALTVAALEAMYKALGVDHEVDVDAVRELVARRQENQ